MQKIIIQHLDNPLSDNKDLVEVDYKKQSLNELVAAVIPEGMDFRVYKNGALLTVDDLDFFAPVRLHDMILVVPVLHSDGIGKILGMIAIAVLSVATYGAAAGWAVGAGIGTFSAATGYSAAAMAVGAAAGAAVSIVGGMLLNQLFPVDMPGQGSLEPGSHYSWNPQVTQEQGTTIQKIYGTLRVKHGNVINAFRSIESGINPNNLNVMVSYGYGPIKSILDVKVNDQYDYEDNSLVLYRRLGYLNQSVIPGFETSVVPDTSFSSLTDTSGEFTRQIAAGYDRVAISIAFPNGLFNTSTSSGNRTEYEATFTARLVNNTTAAVQYFAGDGNATVITEGVLWSFGEWLYTKVYGREAEYTESEWIQYDSKVIIDLNESELSDKDPLYPNAFWRKLTSARGRMQYEDVYYYGATENITITQATADYFDFNLVTEIHPDYAYTLYIERTNAEPSNGVSTSNLTAVKSIANESYEYPKNTLLAIAGAPTERFNGGLDIEPLFEGALVNVYNGSTWNVEYSNNPAWVAYDIATQPVMDNTLAIQRYDGFQPSRVNLNDFYTWAQVCDTLVPDDKGGTEKRFVFNGVFDSTLSLWDALLKVGSTFRTFIYWNGTELKCYTEEKATTINQVFSDGNIIENSFSEVFSSWEDRATEIDLRFSDEEADYETTQITVHDVNLTQTRNKISIEAFGTTKRSQAWRIATFMLKKNLYLFRTISFDVYAEYLDCTLGDVIEFQHNLPDWGDGGRLDSVDLGSYCLYVNGLLSAIPFLEIGFSQATYDSWLEGSAGSEIDNGVTSGVTLHIRTASGTYDTYDVFGVGWDEATGLSKLILDSASVFTNSPQADDLYALSTTSNGATRWFRILDISAASDQVATLTAIEYNDAVFDETDIAPVVDQITYSPIITFPSVSGIGVISWRYYNAYNTYVRDLEISWTLPADITNYRQSNITVLGGSSATTFEKILGSGTTVGNSWILPSVELFGWYRIIVAVTNKDGQTQDNSLATSLNYTVSDTEDTAVPIMTDGVSGLVVRNSTGDGTTFASKDCLVGWDAPTGIWEDTTWLQHYLVEVLTQGTSTIIYSETTKSNSFDFTLDKNREAGLVRTFDVKVTPVATNGNTGTSGTITAVNNQAGQVQNLAAVTSFSSAELSWDVLAESDLAGYEIHISTTDNFTPDSSTLYARVPASSSSETIIATSDNTYYFRIGAFDVFGTTGISYSADSSYLIISTIAATELSGFAEELSNMYSLPVIPDGVFGSDGVDTFSWIAHTFWYNGVEISISAGSTTDKYIWWNGDVATTYSTTNDVTAFKNLDPNSPTHDWQIAINYGTYYELGYQSAANMVIGTAKIGEAEIQNVNIGDIVESTGFDYVAESAPGAGDGNADGWRLDKTGALYVQDLLVLNEDGSTLLQAGDTLANPLADVTGDNTSADSDALGGTAATTVLQDITDAANTAIWASVSGAPTSLADLDSAMDTLVNSLDSQMDNKVATYIQSAQPHDTNSADDTGDKWYDTDVKKWYEYNGSSWIEVDSSVADVTLLADGKTTTYYGSVTPTTEGVDGDFYVKDDGTTITFYKKVVTTWTVTGTYTDGADVTDYSDYRVSNSEDSDGILTIANPQGAKADGGNGTLGAIVVTLPQSWTSTMMKMEIDVYIYSATSAFTALVGGYNYAGSSSWYNEYAQIIGNTAANNRVRFGHDGTKCCIVIGDEGSSWSYPKIVVKNFQAGYAGATIANWATGWNVSFVTDLSSYTFTGDFSDTLLDAKSILGQGALALQDRSDLLYADGADVTAEALSAKTSISEGGLRVSDLDLNRYAEITPGSVSLFRNGILYTALSRTEFGRCSAGVEVVFDPPFITTPTVFCIIQRMPILVDATFDNYLEVEAMNITQSSFMPSGLYINENQDTLSFVQDFWLEYLEVWDYYTLPDYGSDLVAILKLDLRLGSSNQVWITTPDGGYWETVIEEGQAKIEYETYVDGTGAGDWVTFTTPTGCISSYIWSSAELPLSGYHIRVTCTRTRLYVRTVYLTGEGADSTLDIDMMYFAVEGGKATYPTGTLL